MAFFFPRHASPRHEVQQAPLVQLRWPADRNLKSCTHWKIVAGREQHTRTANVQCFADAVHYLGPLAEGLVPELAFNRKSARSTAVGVHGVELVAPGTSRIQRFSHGSDPNLGLASLANRLHKFYPQVWIFQRPAQLTGCLPDSPQKNPTPNSRPFGAGLPCQATAGPLQFWT